MIRFQADADLKLPLVAATLRREPTIDFRTVHEAGLAGLDDVRVLEIAAEAGRILVSHDAKTMPRHFGELIEARSSPGLLIVPQWRPIAESAEDLVLIWAATEPSEWVDRIFRLPL